MCIELTPILVLCAVSGKEAESRRGVRALPLGGEEQCSSRLKRYIRIP